MILLLLIVTSTSTPTPSLPTATSLYTPTPSTTRTPIPVAVRRPMTPARVPSALPALPQHWATEWFLVELELDGQFSDAALTRVRSSLLPLFPHAFPTRLQEATALYNLRDYDAATARILARLSRANADRAPRTARPAPPAPKAPD